MQIKLLLLETATVTENEEHFFKNHCKISGKKFSRNRLATFCFLLHIITASPLHANVVIKNLCECYQNNLAIVLHSTCPNTDPFSVCTASSVMLEGEALCSSERSELNPDSDSDESLRQTTCVNVRCEPSSLASLPSAILPRSIQQSDVENWRLSSHDVIFCARITLQMFAELQTRATMCKTTYRVCNNRQYCTILMVW